MKRFLAGVIVALLFDELSVAHAMSVLPPTFEELVAEARLIMKGTVVEVSPFTTQLDDGQKVIKTRVTWQREKSWKSTTPERYSLEFLSGEAEGTRMYVPGMPAFRKGDRDYLFFGKSERALVPLIAGEHGRFRRLVDPESGQEQVKHAPALRAPSGHQPADGSSRTLGTDLPETPEGFERALETRLGREDKR